MSLELHYRDLAPGAEGKTDLAPPEPHESAYVIPLAGLAGGAVLLASGSIIVGVLVLLASVVVGGVMAGKVEKVRADLARWKRLKYCEGCGGRYEPSETKI